MQIPSLQELGSQIQQSVPCQERKKENRLSRFRTSAVLLIADGITLGVLISLAVVVRSHFSQNSIPFSSYLLITAILVVGNALASAWRGIYPGYGMCAIAELRSTFYSVTGVYAAVIAFTFFSKDWMPYARSILLGSYLISVPAVALMRMSVRKLLSRFSWYGLPVLIIGPHSMASRIVETLHNHLQIGLRPLAIIEPDELSAEYGYHRGVPIIGGLKNVDALARRFDVRHGVVAISHSWHNQMNELLEHNALHLSHITVVGEHVHPSVIWISNTANGVFLTSEIEQRLREPSLRFKKRMFDLIIGIPLFVVALPIMAAISVAILITMRRPLLYRQSRGGADGKPFSVVKFRTMITNADERLADILSKDKLAKQEWDLYHKLKNDPRVTALGQFLRKYSLDELPQLWNVLRGDMSLVGFRPFTVEESKTLTQIHRRNPLEIYDSTKPGLSGLWQVTVRSNAVFEDRTHIDIYYMRNWSIFLDLYILLRTVGVVLTGRGAY